MTRKFSELEAKMSPVAKLRVDQEVRKAMAKMPLSASGASNVFLTDWNWDDAKEVWQEEDNKVLELVKTGEV